MKRVLKAHLTILRAAAEVPNEKSAESLQVVANQIWRSNVKAGGLTGEPAVRLQEISSLVTHVSKRLHELAKIGVVITECDALNDSVVARCMVFLRPWLCAPVGVNYRRKKNAPKPSIE